MGTDIHGVFQRHDASTGKWVDVPTKYEEGRHYQLFAVLAGVRNGSGFAGVKTGDAVEPISEPRGLPDDFEINDEGAHPVASIKLLGYKAKYYEAGEAIHIWMGDHSPSWLTADEILAWAEKAPTVEKCGVISAEAYMAWDRVSAPAGYCGAKWGRNVVVVSQAEADAGVPHTDVQVTWKSDLRSELAYFFDEVARLVAEHGQVRFVFGFDS